MATVSRPRRAREFSCKQLDWRTIEVNGQVYNVETFDPGESGTAAVRLAKHAADGAVYDLVRTHEGLIECDCPHYEARIRGNSCDCCKHGKALVALGLLDAPRPTPPPTARPSAQIPGVTRVRDEFDEPAGDDDLPPGTRIVDPARIPADPTPPEKVRPETPPPAAPEPAPTPEPSLVPGLPLDELAAAQASYYRSWGTEAGDLFAEHFEMLVANLRCCSTPGRPLTPDQYRGRIEALEDYDAER